MKKTIITILALIFSISFCMAQNIREEAEKKIQRETQQQQTAKQAAEAAEKQKQAVEAAEAQRRRELETRYQEIITSAQRNFEQQQYAQAKQDYQTALELKPENAASINPKIDEIDRMVRETERDHKYLEAIASAQRNFDQRQYVQAKQDYQTALELKPENADFINSKIAEIDKPALLYIYRKRKVLDILPKRYDIFLDNVVVGTSTNNWKTTITVTTFGTKTISATIDERQAVVQNNFEPGGVYYVRSDVNTETIDTGNTITTTNKKTGKTTTSKVIDIQYTPILQLMDKSIGGSEFNAIK